MQWLSLDELLDPSSSPCIDLDSLLSDIVSSLFNCGTSDGEFGTIDGGFSNFGTIDGGFSIFGTIDG